ncbi:MAG: GDP-mannose 4,6-dehydratase [Candidatus Tyrphobacter sp.]
MRALVTGAGGFVGRHLVAALRGDGWVTFAAGGPSDENVETRLDLANRKSLDEALGAARPDVVFHLAAQSFIPQSLRAPTETYEVNVTGTVALSSAMRAYAQQERMPRLLFASSSEVYGARDPSEMPLRETLAPEPRNPYAASKAAAEGLLLGEMHALGGDVVITRGFNHIGPGQDARFAVASFAHDLARIAAGGEPVLLVGNLDAQRDVLDVRDVVRAYVALAKSGGRGEIYNVCRGSAVAIRDLVGALVRIARVPVQIRTDPARLRPADVPLLVGSNAKLAAVTGWEPKVPLEQSLRDIYDDARNRLGS